MEKFLSGLHSCPPKLNLNIFQLMDTFLNWRVIGLPFWISLQPDQPYVHISLPLEPPPIPPC